MGRDRGDCFECGNFYFDLLAEIGITKHPGGKAATGKIAELCGISPETSVLDVGCGVGNTAAKPRTGTSNDTAFEGRKS